MKELFLDLETASSVDLAKAGVYRYAEAEDFNILLFSCSVDWGEVKVYDLAHGDVLPMEILSALTDKTVTKWAYNCNFERVCLSRFLGYPVGSYIPPEQFKCVMTWGATCGLPMSLEAISEVMHLRQGKLDTGKALIRKFCKPGIRLPGRADPDWQMFCEYNRRDVEAEMEICQKLAPWPVPEFVWQEFFDSERINDRGIAIDKKLVRNAIRMSEAVTADLIEQMEKLTGLQNPNSVTQLKWWLQQQGVTVSSLGKKDVEALLEKLECRSESSEVARERPQAPCKRATERSEALGESQETTASHDFTASSALKPFDEALQNEKYGCVAEVLRLRQQLSKSSVKKYQAMEASVNADGRVRGMFQFYGANRTGRFASKRIQLQNLPKNHMEDLDKARALVKAGDRKALQQRYSDVQDVLSQLVRTAFIPATRSQSSEVARRGDISLDFTAPSALKGKGKESGSEGREPVPCILSPESCPLPPTPYILPPKLLVADESSIEARVLSWLAGEQWRIKAFAAGKDIYCESASRMFHVPVEKNGINAHLRPKGKVAELALGYQGGVGALKKMGALEQGLAESELQPIVDAWRAANLRIVKFWYDIGDAALNAVIYRGETQSHGFRFLWEKGFLFIELLSGRRLAYYGARLGTNKFGSDCITYYGISPTKKWEKLETSPGKLVENIVQATARDVLCYALGNLSDEPVVMHVHDEIICESGGSLTLEKLCNVMGQTPPWAPGLLLRAEGDEMPYYQKT